MNAIFNVFFVTVAGGTALASAAEREFRVEPSVTLKAELHDRNAVGETARWVSEIDPVVAIRYRSGDSLLSLAYSPRLVFTDLGNQRSDLSHALNAQGSIGLLSNRFTLGANAFVGEQSRDPLAPVLSDSLFFNERLRTISGGVSAGIRDSVLPGVFGQLKANFQTSKSSYVNREESLVESGLDALPRSDRLTITGELKPTERRPVAGWTAGGEYSRNSLSQNGGSYASYKGYLGALWNPSSQLGAFAKLGYEQGGITGQDEKAKGAYADIGAEWRPNARIEIKGEIGKHYFGLAHQLSVRLREPRSTWELTARRQLINSQDSVLFPQTDSPLTLLDRVLSPTITDPALRSAEVQRLAGLFNLPGQLPEARYFFTDRIVLEESARVSGLYNFPRIAVNGFAQYRQVSPTVSEISSLRANATRPLTEIGASIGASYRLSAVSSIRLDLTGDRVRVDDTGQTSKRFRTNLALLQQWTRAISTGATIFYDRNKSDSIAAGYDDRGVTAFVRFNFY